MKSKTLHIILITLLALSLCGCNTSMTNANDPVELKVLSWNIWHGGHSKAYPEKSCENALAILKKSNADIITMIETYGNSNMVADYLGYYHRLLSSNLSIYSRYPIIETYSFPDSISTFNFAGVKIDVNGKHVIVFDTWLHYLPDCTAVPTEKSEQEIIEWSDAGTRDNEINSIMSVIHEFVSNADQVPIIMAGDFNDHSHLDWTEATKDLYNHDGRVVPWTVSKVMESYGFKDSFREKHPNPEKNVEELGPTWYWRGKEKSRLDRIDYIYYKGEKLEVLGSESFNCDIAGEFDIYGEKYFYPSDHGFVMTKFSLK